jgi:hypothetical protein
MHAFPKQRLRLNTHTIPVFTLLVVAMLGGVQGVLGQPGPGGRRQNPLADEQERLCSTVTLHFRCLRQPPVYHIGETIQARLSFSGKGQHGFTAMPEPRRGDFSEIIVTEPKQGTIDPRTLDNRIRVGGTGSWSEARSLDREIDVNEWVQFQRSGRYVLRVVLKRIVLKRIVVPPGSDPFRHCELKSNAEPVEVLPPDTHWEAAELARIGALLESVSEKTRYRGASALRYLNTPEAAVALAKWFVRLPGGPVNSELAKGIFESRYPDIVQSNLEQALRQSDPFLRGGIVGVLATLEVRRQFIGRPPPSDPKAAQTWSREYWELFDSVKRKYSAAAQSGREVPH